MSKRPPAQRSALALFAGLALASVASPPAAAQETQVLLRFLERETASLREETATGKAEMARHKALVQMCRVIFNLNEFVYAD